MSDYLMALPVELIHKILDNVSTIDIFLSICLVNKHLRAVCLAYPRFQLDFSDVNTLLNKNQFDCICTQLLSSISKIVSLTLFDKQDPMTPIKNALFFSRFSCIDTTFSSLRSLTLTYITYDTWRLFKTRLPSSITMLSINLVDAESFKCSLMTSAILSELLFFSPSLECLSVKMNNYSDDTILIRSSNPTITSSVQFLQLEDINIDLSSLFHVVPILHVLEIQFIELDYAFDNIHPQPMHLQRLRIEIKVITWTEMITLISSFPRLIYLTVIVDDCGGDMVDGFAWAKLLKDIKHFEFKLYFDQNNFDEQLFNLNSFRTKFWLEEKKWFVIYDQNVKNDYSILYTNPSSIDDYPSHDMIAIIVSESAESEPVSFPYIHCLTINYQYIKYALLHRYTHITELNFSAMTTTFSMTFTDMITYLGTMEIIKCDVNCEWIRKSPDELTEFLRSLSHLRAISVSVSVLNYLVLHQWPDIIHLRIEHDYENNLQLSSSDDIDVLCHSFPNIERFDIHSTTVANLPYLLNKMKKTLTDIIIRQPLTDKNEQLITREWIEQNTKLQHFHYTCDTMNSVYLWL